MKNKNSVILSIAGFDPCAGAGILADVKTCQAHGVYCFGVVSSLTFQNESKFSGVEWVKPETIISQLTILFEKYKIKFVKIGLIENFDVLQKILSTLFQVDESIKIIWDPILKASAGFDFHSCVNLVKLNRILDSIYLITPNIPEAIILFETSEPEVIKLKLELFPKLHVLLKGGHSKNDEASDILISCKEIIIIEGVKIKNVDKHGTGCVLSSSITSELSLGKNLIEACIEAKAYMNRFLTSSGTLLGIHTKT